MASRKENIKSLFSNTRTRVIIVFTIILVLLAVLIGFVKLRSSTPDSLDSNVSSAPGGIQSIPGSSDPTAQYVKLQQQQNIEQALQAEQKGGSAIPTIIKTQALGQGVSVIGSKNGSTGGVGFSALVREDEGGAQRSLWVQTLQNSNCSKSSYDQVISQGGQLNDIKTACSCVQLKDIGIGLQDLEQVCACKELKAAGYNARQLKEIGYTAGRLRACGFDACELRNAGFSAQEMKDGGFSDGELKGAGFSEDEINRAGGLPPGVSVDSVQKAGCGEAALRKLRSQGVSASAIRRINGCSLDALKNAGFSAKELKDAGFSAAELKNAGFTAAELRGAGYSARDLLNAGYSPKDLADAGYSQAQIKTAGAELPPGITPADVKNSGCDVDELKRERAAGVSAASIRQMAGCSAEALKAAGYTDQDLANAGFSPQEISAAGAMSDNAIKAAACDPVQLKKLFKAGVSAQKIKDLNGCNAEALKEAGFSAKSLIDAGYTPDQLLKAGFTAQQLENAGLNPAAILAAGRKADCSPDYLKQARAAGVSAATIRQTLGCSAAAMKAAGYTAKELKDAGFTAAELRAAGFSAQDLKNAGFSPKELRDAGFSAADLKALGYTAKDLKDAGFNAEDLKNAGYSAAQLKAAGFSAKDLKSAGFSPTDLKNAGFNASELKDAGFSSAELKAAGFSAASLKDAGFALDESAVAGLSQPTISASASNMSGFPGFEGGASNQANLLATNSRQLQTIINKQNEQMNDQKYQQKVQQRSAAMLSAANQSVQVWKQVNSQVYVGGQDEGKDKSGSSMVVEKGSIASQEVLATNGSAQPALIKTGDIVFAVVDTSVNSDEPGPILATIVSGKLKGAKLIGSFNLPSNSNKMVITFNTMSVPGASKTTSISSYAIDPNTARTALSSRTDHHYLMRYGSLFASSFIEGFGNAFQSANTTVTIGGTGGGNNVTVQNGIGRSTLQNAVIGLATVGKSWGQAAQQVFNTPTTVEVYSGTGIGVLFTQDVRNI